MPESLVYLYVEDDALSREIMKMIVEHRLPGSTLFIFENSANFEERIAALPRQPDVIMLDIHLRPVDGFTLLTWLRAHPVYQSRRIIALTASVMNEEVTQLRNAGFDGAIAKPVNLSTFPGLIARVVEGHPVWHIS